MWSKIRRRRRRGEKRAETIRNENSKPMLLPLLCHAVWLRAEKRYGMYCAAYAAMAACPRTRAQHTTPFISTDKTMDEYDFDELIWIYYIFSFCFVDRPLTRACHSFFFQRSWINNNLRKINVKNKGNTSIIVIFEWFHWTNANSCIWCTLCAVYSYIIVLNRYFVPSFFGGGRGWAVSMEKNIWKYPKRCINATPASIATQCENKTFSILEQMTIENRFETCKIRYWGRQITFIQHISSLHTGNRGTHFLFLVNSFFVFVVYLILLLGFLIYTT